MFKKYMHVERIGSSDVDGLLIGEVLVQPKIDGANAQVWLGDNEIMAGSRNQIVDVENDLMGFDSWVTDNAELLANVLRKHPTWRLYGEWLVPHSLKTYRDEAWRNFYVFDVLDDETDQFIPYSDYVEELMHHGIQYVPLMATVENPTEEILRGYLERNTYLIKDGQGFGEGIVVKRYDFVNKYGRTVWGKLVRNEFKEKNVQEMGAPHMKLKPPDERQFAEQYVTRGRIEKELTRMGEWNSRRIPELFGVIYHDLVTQELWEFVKSKKNKAVLDFNALYQQVVAQVKTQYPELF